MRRDESATVLVWLVPTVVLAALVPLGARSVPAFYFVSLLVCLAFLAIVTRSLTRNGTSETALLLTKGLPLGPVLALPAYVCVQLIAQSAIGISEGPIFATAQSVSLFVALAVFFVLVRFSVRTARDFRFVLRALAFIGGAEALYGLLNLLGGNERVLFWERELF